MYGRYPCVQNMRVSMRSKITDFTDFVLTLLTVLTMLTMLTALTVLRVLSGAYVANRANTPILYLSQEV